MTHEALRTIWRSTWAILPDALRVAIADARADVPRPPMRAAEPTSVQVPGGIVAVLPVRGVVSYRADFFSEFFGGAVVERLSAQLWEAVANPQVKAIMLSIDSPGGMVSGLPEFAAELRTARGIKPILALADTTAASAAYWIGSQATEFWAVPSADVGSVGVYAIHEDFSKLLEQAGVTVTLISAGQRKTDGNPYEPLSDDARANIQARVDDVYGQFIEDVAKGRGVTTAAVRERYGHGRVLSAKDALAAGMVDRVGTWRQAAIRASKLRTPAQAAADELDLRARQHRLLDN
jgi:signal peptide peptidase SppA